MSHIKQIQISNNFNDTWAWILDNTLSILGLIEETAI